MGKNGVLKGFDVAFKVEISFELSPYGDIEPCSAVFIEIVFVDDTRFDVVIELEIEEGAYFLSDGGVIDGESRFDPEAEVSFHPVGAAEEHTIFAVVVEDKHACMFEETVHDAEHFNIFTEPRDTGHEAADTANDQLNFDACGRSFVQFKDDFFVFQAVEFEDHEGDVAFFSGGDFMVDEFVQFISEVKFAHQEVFERFGVRFYIFEETEQVIDFAGKTLVGGKNSEVGVHFSGFFVEVAGTEVGVELWFAGFDASEQRQFGVDFNAREGVVNADAGFFESFAPFEVGSFIESGFNFYESGHLFATLDGFHECLEDAAVFGDPVLDDLDVCNGGVMCGAFEQIDDRLKGLVGYVEELVFLEDGLKGVFSVVECRVLEGRQGFVFQVIKSEIGEFEEVEIVVVTAFGEHIIFAQVEGIL